ncbi:MAG: transporter substrate-binding protein [Microbacterium sp.]|nr:transporter substrate-binding protein [Microbacterium sp.]
MSFASTSRSRLLAAAGVAVSAILVLAGCATSSEPATSGAGESQDFGDINVQLSWLKNTEFSGEYLALDEGYYADNGFSDVTLTAGGSGATSAVAAVSTGQAFVGISGPLQVAPAILQGAQVKIIATGYQKNPFNIISLSEDPIENPKDMVGKTIAVSDSNTLVFQALLKTNGIDPSSLTVVPFSDISQLTTGQVDGYLGYTTSGPYALKLQGHEATEFLLADYGMTIVSETYIATDDVIENEPEKVKAYLTALIEGWHAALADPQKATEAAVNDYGKDQNYNFDQQLNAFTVQKGLQLTTDTEANGLFTMTQDLIDSNIATLALCGFDISADQLFDMSLLDEVYAENPDLKELS